MNKTLRFFVISGTFALLAATSACTVQGGVRTTRPMAAPSLVAIGGGVYVVENHSQAVFYSDGYYWMAGNGGWYRSSYYDRGWGYVDYAYVPRSVVTIRQPRSYVRYRARPGMPVHQARSVDHRWNRPAPRSHAPPVHRRNTRVNATRGHARPPQAQPVRRGPAPVARPAKPAPARVRHSSPPRRRSHPSRDR